MEQTIHKEYTKMLKRSELSKLHSQLLDRRNDIVASGQSLDQSWLRLREREPEIEEAAQKETIATGMDRVYQREEQELKAIDAALKKMHDGTYGTCESCGRGISFKRLKAVPWTALCMKCAEKQGGKKRAPGVPPASEPLPSVSSVPDVEDSSDEQLCEAIYEEIENDGRVEIETLEISCNDGVVFIKGSLTSQLKHKALLSILQDVMHLEDIVDETEVYSPDFPPESSDEPEEETRGEE